MKLGSRRDNGASETTGTGRAAGLRGSVSSQRRIRSGAAEQWDTNNSRNDQADFLSFSGKTIEAAAEAILGFMKL
ncbi:hypothetical protein PGT21_036992 [Puccinia graminis f. sp. tritici]|uniref:Uncharacterized protein n=1 Tax=Puccinia graminis f. sp. tritici TaxID=56615 RepID=A0A5B0QDK0_PUCGR|nr:hypothetical protein PGT21_036992 [Puccinia graminis f. sp. tritici]